MATQFKGPIEGTLYLRRIPKYLRDQFHAACARRGTPMKFQIVKFMREFVEAERNIGQQPRGKK